MATKEITTDYLWKILEEVSDPEIPVLSVVDLGVVREIEPLGFNEWYVKITPTYTGCPAMIAMENDIRRRIEKEGAGVTVETVLSPAWTTDWLSESGREKLEKYGITPPQEEGDNTSLFGKRKNIPCPRCKSTNTTLVSEFGSTACKALYKCDDCHEPFDYFKCHR